MIQCWTRNIIIIIIKKDPQCKAGRVRLTPYQSEDPSPTLPTYRGNEEKRKIVEDKNGERVYHRLVTFTFCKGLT